MKNLTFGSDNNTSFEEKKMNLEAGWFGKVFGNATSAPTNIAGISIILLLGISIYMTASKISTDIWSVTSPLISLILGYLFGKNT